MSVLMTNQKPGWLLSSLPPDLRMSAHSQLDRSDCRQPCPHCQRSRQYFCYDCLLPFTEVPRVDLPHEVRIIAHHAESRSHSTGVHAAIICRDAVKLIGLKDVSSLCPERAVLLFPSPDAVTPDMIDSTSFDTLFVVDAKWRKASAIMKGPPYSKMRHAKLLPAQTAFWRFQPDSIGADCVSTIESIYYFFKQMCEAHGPHTRSRPGKEGDSCHCYDNLLWYFAHQHMHIASAALKRLEDLPEYRLKAPKASELDKEPDGSAEL